MSDASNPVGTTSAPTTSGGGNAGEVITGASDAAGAARAVAEAEKFRNHKDNPAQPPKGVEG